MKYTFPIIQTIEDVLPAFDEKFFYKGERDGYTVINYHCITDKTFPSVTDNLTAIRREFRGIIFDEAGNIIRRPYHKFFNVGERLETHLENIDVAEEHYVLDKLDGSMIAPFFVGLDLFWGTKMGYTDVSKPVHEFIERNKHYENLASDLIALGFTPIFEWCSNKQRIVIDYPEDQLVLTAVRNMTTGNYEKLSSLHNVGKTYEVPVVGHVSGETLSKSFFDITKGIEDVEGFVVRFTDGHMVKIKCDWYCSLHRVKSDIAKERGVVALIINETLDDLKPLMSKEDLEYINTFENTFLNVLAKYIEEVHEMSLLIRSKNLTRKEFALNHAPNLQKWQVSCLFNTWEVSADDLWVQLTRALKEQILKNTNKEKNYQEFRKSFPTLPVYNANIYIGDE